MEMVLWWTKSNYILSTLSERRMTMANAPHLRTARESIVQPSGLIKLDFLRNTSQYIKEMLNADRVDIDAMKMEISLIEKGRLRIHSKTASNKCYFGIYTESAGREEGTDDYARIHMIARREFLETRLKQIELNCHRLSRIINNIDYACEEERFRRKLQRFNDSNLDLCRILFTKEQNEWIDEPYAPNPYHTENLRYHTKGGIPVRSLSEARLFSGVESFGLPYRYDDIVKIFIGDHGGTPFRDSYFADLKIPNLLWNITINEHLGAFHIEKYPDNSLKRLNDYHNFDIYEIPGQKLRSEEITFSFDSDLKTPFALQKLIMKMLLPR
jgi:hypothetical protein